MTLGGPSTYRTGSPLDVGAEATVEARARVVAMRDAGGFPLDVYREALVVLPPAHREPTWEDAVFVLAVAIERQRRGGPPRFTREQFDEGLSRRERAPAWREEGDPCVRATR